MPPRKTLTSVPADRPSRAGASRTLISRRAPGLCAVAVAAALLATSGCGGDDKKDPAGTTATPTTSTGGPEAAEVKAYATGFAKAASEFNAGAQAASIKVQAATTVADRLKALDSLKTLVTQAADAFAELNPPDVVKVDNENLVTGLRGFADDVTHIQVATKAQDADAAVKAGAALKDRQTKIQESLRNIAEKLRK